jgi:hypothetical protein
MSDAQIAELEASVYGLQVHVSHSTFVYSSEQDGYLLQNFIFILNTQVIAACGYFDFCDQIIRNADLEELRELGSGTFGTVYHGKWRGTDVAIKRIKKSCFAGRSSEQEKLVSNIYIGLF